MKKYTFFLGLNDKDTKTQKVDTYATLAELQTLVAMSLGGGSLSLVNGVFRHDDGIIVHETTVKIETLGFGEESGYKLFAEIIRDKYNQESVLMEVVEVDAQFI